MATTTNYRSIHFQVSTPTIITDEPTYKSLSILYDQIKINAQSVPSNGGGGNHGHLGLVLTPVEYQLISLKPFIHPVNPGEFIYPTGNTPEEITVLGREHIDHQQQFQKIEQVELALKQFLIEALDPDYLLEIRNPTTKRLQGTIPIIMTSLFQAYANITAQSVVEKATLLTNFE